MLYLIAHKVRGEPAYDVAEPIDMADGRWWIIPTSGHRAYPFWHTPLDLDSEAWQIPQMPAELRDHYQTTQATEPPRSGRSGVPARGIAPPTAEDL